MTNVGQIFPPLSWKIFISALALMSDRDCGSTQAWLVRITVTPLRAEEQLVGLTGLTGLTGLNPNLGNS